MEQASEYAERATHAEQQAKRARDDAERDAFLEIANLWRRLAEERYRTLGKGQSSS